MQEDRYNPIFDHYFKDKIKYYEIDDQMTILREKASNFETDSKEYDDLHEQIYQLRRQQCKFIDYAKLYQ